MKAASSKRTVVTSAAKAATVVSGCLNCNCDIFNSQLDFFMLSVTLLQGHRYQSGRDTLWCVYGCFYKFVFGRE